MANNVYDVTDASFARKFAEIERERPEAVKRGVASAILLGAEIVARAAPKDTGELKKSVRGVVHSPGGYIVVDAPHAGIVEMGARPHWVSVKKLLPWCIRHFGPKEARAIAYAIQHKIATEGQAPTYFMRKTLPAQRRILKAEVERELQRG